MQQKAPKAFLAGVIIFLLAMVPAPAFAQTSTLPLRSARETVVQVYAMISESSPAEAKEIYQTLSIDLKADLWLLQIEQFLQGNPTLTLQQRAIVMEAVGLLATGVIRDGARDVATQEQIADLASRADAVFTRSQRALFGQLGSAAVAFASNPFQGSSEAEIPSTASRSLRTLAVPTKIGSNVTCECNTDPSQDFCYETPTSPSNKCRFSPGACTRTTCCCGWFWQEACNGLCNG
jgi:hypothetical protein